MLFFHTCIIYLCFYNVNRFCTFFSHFLLIFFSLRYIICL
nr:MAG TPA: hypothetical protein [Caudoviricetes sp.]